MRFVPPSLNSHEEGLGCVVKRCAYVTGYAIPNLFFHLVTAYNILRKEGIPLGKIDYLTPFIRKHVSE